MKKISNSRDPLEVIGRAKGYSREELVLNLPRHSNYSPALMQRIKKLPEVILRNSGTPLAKKLTE